MLIVILPGCRDVHLCYHRHGGLSDVRERRLRRSEYICFYPEPHCLVLTRLVSVGQPKPTRCSWVQPDSEHDRTLDASRSTALKIRPCRSTCTPISPFHLYHIVLITVFQLNVTLEILLGIDTISSPDPHGTSDAHATTKSSQTNAPATTHHQTNATLKHAFLILERTAFVLLAVGVSILVPEFSSMMAILGSFAAFILGVIGPVSAKVALEGRCGWVDRGLLVMGVVMAVWGTAAAFWSTTEPV